MPDSAAALSVLVLAWDEAAPTVRTVVEAAPAVGSLLVLLPPTLPLPAAQPPLAPILTPSPPATPSLPTAAATQPLAEPTAEPPTVVEVPVLAAALPSPGPAATTVPTRVPQAATPTVRLVHLAVSELPIPIRSSSFQVPAAPYLGATAPTAALAAPPHVPQLPAPVLPAAPILRVAAASPSLASKPATNTFAATQLTAASQPKPATTTTEAAAEDLPAPAATEAPAAPLPLAAAAFAAAEIIDPDPEEELHPTGPRLAAATTPADSLRLAGPPASSLASLGPFGNRLPQFDTSPALPAPRQPAGAAQAEFLEEDTPEERARAFAASVAAAQQYTAPDLNSQVIRYARLAVPRALAEAAHEVIYAPAWPTWLAALELRQRTASPLVLHLPALAAGRQPADTAAGWPAELQRQALRQADLVLVETYALARRLRRELGLGPTTVRVVPTANAAAVARALRHARRRPGLA